MARQPRIEFPGGLYHVISRGIERRAIFSDDTDRRRYLSILEKAVAKFRFHLYAYCLMDNHVHLALEVGTMPISRIMRSVNTTYAGYFNARHRRSGYLFQGRYKSFVVDCEPYLLSLIRYIHENPVKAGIVRVPAEYPWSSHRGYVEEAPSWLAADEVLTRFGRNRSAARRTFAKFFVAEEASPYAAARRFVQAVVGDAAFAERVLEAPIDELVIKKVSARWIVDWTARALGLTPSEIRAPSRAREWSQARSICGLLAREVARLPLAAVAREVGRRQASLWRNVEQLERRMSRDRLLKQRVAGMRAKLVPAINNA
jgi:putative transposase